MVEGRAYGPLGFELEPLPPEPVRGGGEWTLLMRSGPTVGVSGESEVGGFAPEPRNISSSGRP